MRLLFTVIAMCCLTVAVAQNSKHIKGTIRNNKGEPLGNTTIQVVGDKQNAVSDSDGNYSLIINKSVVTLSYSLTGFKTQILQLVLPKSNELQQNVVLQEDVKQLGQVDVANLGVSGSMIHIEILPQFPGASGNFESMLKTLPGVSANNELSSLYSVRGGNFDENLIYVNDIEIYRPLLVRNGQQEGLSFINPEMASSAGFSAGGFEARYGDKLSSVLDVKYGRPDSTQTTVSAGLLGISAALKKPLADGKGYYLIGVRSKTNQGILNSQEVKGSYRPQFYDGQVLVNYDLSKRLNLSLLGGYNRSDFILYPQSRETTFGTLNKLLQLDVAYEGSEKDSYRTITGAATLEYKLPQATFKWINSYFSDRERERFDIEGSYIFDEVLPASAGNIHVNRGIGSYIDHARNQLSAALYSSELRFKSAKGKGVVEAGLRMEHSTITDELSEYSISDSAGYTLPNTPGPFVFANVVNATNSVSLNRLTAFLEDNYVFSTQLTMSAGIRGNYNSFTKQFLVSPRIGFRYFPDGSRQVSVHLSAGSYNQPPFYRELRNLNGSLTSHAKAQRSLHFLTGADYFFKGMGTRLKFSSELYYKKLSDLVPYKVENLRIRYFADQHAKGYAAGADFSLSGKFVSGLESSFRLSLMKTAEDIDGDFYFKKDAAGNTIRVEPGYLKRPTDQRVNFSIFFQDELPKNPSYKVHLSLLYGSALPAGPPGTQRYADVFEIPSYRRVDIGFSKDFIDQKSKVKATFLNRNFESLIAYAEIFNLLNINNTVSYLWIKDVDNNQYAIPNYLTSRQLSFKIIAKLKNK